MVRVYEKDWRDVDREQFNEGYMVRFGTPIEEIEKIQNSHGFFYDEGGKWYRDFEDEK